MACESSFTSSLCCYYLQFVNEILLTCSKLQVGFVLLLNFYYIVYRISQWKSQAISNNGTCHKNLPLSNQNMFSLYKSPISIFTFIPSFAMRTHTFICTCPPQSMFPVKVQHHFCAIWDTYVAQFEPKTLPLMIGASHSHSWH